MAHRLIRKTVRKQSFKISKTVDMVIKDGKLTDKGKALKNSTER